MDIEDVRAERTQRIYARLAGLLFLAEIVLAFGGGFILSAIAGSGTFAETAHRMAAGERLYRMALSIQLLAILGGVLFFFALYATVRPVNSLLAQLAMIFGLVDSVLGLLVRMCDFVRLHLSISAQTAGAGTGTMQALSDLMRNIATTTENVGGIPFGISLLLFFYLFWESRYIPRIVSGLGLSAFTIWIALYFASLVFPGNRGLFLFICYPPTAIALVVTGFWLLLFAVKSHEALSTT